MIENQDKKACDIQIICKDGDIFYTRLLLYFMQPALKCALTDRDEEDQSLVIIFPSCCVKDIINFYADKFKIQQQSPLVEETSNSEDITLLNVCEKCGNGFNSIA